RPCAHGRGAYPRRARHFRPAVPGVQSRVRARQGRQLRHRTGAGVVPSVRDEQWGDAARHDALWHQRPSYRRVLLQRLGARVARRGRDRSAGGQRSSFDQGLARRLTSLPAGRQENMFILTVYEPPPETHETAPHPEPLRFLRGRLSVWAFLLTPWWMLRHRLWLALTGYVIVAIALAVALRSLGASTGVTITVAALLSFLVGFEAATLRRFTLSRRGWRNVGIVVGDDLESAERRFFDAWVHKPWADQSSVDGAPRASSPAMGVPMARRPSSEVIGLFPQPGAPR